MPKHGEPLPPNAQGQRDRQIIEDARAILRNLGTVINIKREQIADLLKRLSPTHSKRTFLLKLEADLIVAARVYQHLDDSLN
jgi:CBS-domain-containing membrane protein